MTNKQVFGDVPCNDLFIGLKSIGEPLSHHACDLKTDMQELPEMGVIFGGRLDVPQCVGVLD
jgi:hypothetical protein